jgi:protein SCO1/2
VAVACGGDADPAAAPAAPTATATAELAATAAPTAAPTPGPTPTDTTTASLGEPEPAPELADLVNPDGSAFDLANYQGANTLVFFGYTHCPDVCPTTIGEIYGVFDAVPDTQAVFVSVDPERDTPDFLTEWMEYKPDNFHAVTGSPGAIRRAADNYGVKYARVETTSTAGYTMSHSADLYLIDDEGQLLQAYPYGTLANEIVEDLAMLDAS